MRNIASRTCIDLRVRGLGQGRSDGGISVYIPPNQSTLNFLCACFVSLTHLYPPKSNSWLRLWPRLYYWTALRLVWRYCKDWQEQKRQLSILYLALHRPYCLTTRYYVHKDAECCTVRLPSSECDWTQLFIHQPTPVAYAEFRSVKFKLPPRFPFPFLFPLSFPLNFFLSPSSFFHHDIIIVLKIC